MHALFLRSRCRSRRTSSTSRSSSSSASSSGSCSEPRRRANEIALEQRKAAEREARKAERAAAASAEATKRRSKARGGAGDRARDRAIPYHTPCPISSSPTRRSSSWIPRVSSPARRSSRSRASWTSTAPPRRHLQEGVGDGLMNARSPRRTGAWAWPAWPTAWCSRRSPTAAPASTRRWRPTCSGRCRSSSPAPTRRRRSTRPPARQADLRCLLLLRADAGSDVAGMKTSYRRWATTT